MSLISKISNSKLNGNYRIIFPPLLVSDQQPERQALITHFQCALEIPTYLDWVNRISLKSICILQDTLRVAISYYKGCYGCNQSFATSPLLNTIQPVTGFVPKFE